MADIIKVDDASFSKAISSGVVLVDFHADWCGPCRVLAPVLEKLASELGDKMQVIKVDVDHASKTASQFQIMSVPTLILFKNGQEITRIIGAQSLEALKKLVTPSL